MMVGLYNMNNRFLVLKLWMVDVDFKEEFLGFFFFWVKFFNFFFNCWGVDFLSRIVSCLGFFFL